MTRAIQSEVQGIKIIRINEGNLIFCGGMCHTVYANVSQCGNLF